MASKMASILAIYPRGGKKSTFSATFHITHNTDSLLFERCNFDNIIRNGRGRRDIDVLSACFMKGVCCKLTYPAAILDAMVHGF